MNQSLHDIELIERYFDNALSHAETADLKDRLKADPELKRLFDQEKLLVNTIRYQGAQHNLQFLKHLEKSFGQPQRHLMIKSWHYYAAAACVALLIAAGIFLPFSEESSQELYANYFEPYPNVF